MFKEKGLEGWLKYGVKLGRMCGLLALPMAQQVKNLPAVQETQEMQVLSLVWEDIFGKAQLCFLIFWNFSISSLQDLLYFDIY